MLSINTFIYVYSYSYIMSYKTKICYALCFRLKSSFFFKELFIAFYGENGFGAHTFFCFCSTSSGHRDQLKHRQSASLVQGSYICYNY